MAAYIHGGNFGFGSPLQFDKNAIVDNFNNVTRDVIFVTITFRQAMFGILNLNWKLDLSMDMNPGFKGEFLLYLNLFKLDDLIFNISYIS